MKRKIIYLMLAVYLGVASCSNSTEKSESKESKEETKEIIYTCPMHPEVISDKPGTCPKCNMELVKKE